MQDNYLNNDEVQKYFEKITNILYYLNVLNTSKSFNSNKIRFISHNEDKIRIVYNSYNTVILHLNDFSAIEIIENCYSALLDKENYYPEISFEFVNNILNKLKFLLQEEIFAKQNKQYHQKIYSIVDDIVSGKNNTQHL